MTRYLITLGILIGIPLVLQVRRAPVWMLFLAVGVIYAAQATYDFLYVRAALGAAQAGDPFTFSLLNVTPGAAETAITFGALAGLVGLQTRLTALTYPKVTRVLFWVLLAACLVAGARTVAIAWIMQPRDGITPGWVVATAAGKVQSAMYLSYAVAAGLVGLGVWSLIRARVRP